MSLWFSQFLAPCSPLPAPCSVLQSCQIVFTAKICLSLPVNARPCLSLPVKIPIPSFSPKTGCILLPANTWRQTSQLAMQCASSNTYSWFWRAVLSRIARHEIGYFVVAICYLLCCQCYSEILLQPSSSLCAIVLRQSSICNRQSAISGPFGNRKPLAPFGSLWKALEGYFFASPTSCSGLRAPASLFPPQLQRLYWPMIF